MDCHKPRMWLGFRNDEGEKNECYIKGICELIGEKYEFAKI